jgi:hypothetical protein
LVSKLAFKLNLYRYTAEELVAAITEAQGEESSFSAEDVKALAAFIIACGDTDGEINLAGLHTLNSFT